MRIMLFKYTLDIILYCKDFLMDRFCFPLMEKMNLTAELIVFGGFTLGEIHEFFFVS